MTGSVTRNLSILGNVPQTIASANYTLVATDAGGHIYHPSADTTARTWTIPDNSSVPFPIGTVVNFINDTSAGIITLQMATDTLVVAGLGVATSKNLNANGFASIVKITQTRWLLSGAGLA